MQLYGSTTAPNPFAADLVVNAAFVVANAVTVAPDRLVLLALLEPPDLPVQLVRPVLQVHQWKMPTL